MSPRQPSPRPTASNARGPRSGRKADHPGGPAAGRSQTAPGQLPRPQRRHPPRHRRPLQRRLRRCQKVEPAQANHVRRGMVLRIYSLENISERSGHARSKARAKTPPRTPAKAKPGSSAKTTADGRPSAASKSEKKASRRSGPKPFPISQPRLIPAPVACVAIPVREVRGTAFHSALSYPRGPQNQSVAAECLTTPRGCDNNGLRIGVSSSRAPAPWLVGFQVRNFSGGWDGFR